MASNFSPFLFLLRFSFLFVPSLFFPLTVLFPLIHRFVFSCFFLLSIIAHPLLLCSLDSGQTEGGMTPFTHFRHIYMFVLLTVITFSLAWSFPSCLPFAFQLSVFPFLFLPSYILFSFPPSLLLSLRGCCRLSSRNDLTQTRPLFFLTLTFFPFILFLPQSFLSPQD